MGPGGGGHMLECLPPTHPPPSAKYNRGLQGDEPEGGKGGNRSEPISRTARPTPPLGAYAFLRVKPWSLGAPARTSPGTARGCWRSCVL